MPVIDIYQRPGFLLRRAHQISTAIFERSCAHLGLTPAQYGVLSVLAEQPGVDQSSLARAMACCQPARAVARTGLTFSGTASQPGPGQPRNSPGETERSTRCPCALAASRQPQ